MMHVQLPIVYRQKNAVFVFIRVKLSAVLAGEVVPVQDPQRVCASGAPPHGFLSERVSALVTTI